MPLCLRVCSVLDAASFVIVASFIWLFVIAASGAAVALSGLLPRYPYSFVAVDH